MYLFRGRVARVERLESAPQFIEGTYLVRSEVVARTSEPGDARSLSTKPLQVALRLRPSASAREPRGALLRWEQAPLLRRLVYLIPPTALAAARLAVLPQGLLILTGSSLGGAGAGLAAGVGAAALIPLGTRIVEVAPGVLVPDGYELWPRVRFQLVRELLGLEASDHALFLAGDEGPLRLRPDHLVPLDAAMISRLELAIAEPSANEMANVDAPAGPPSIVNQHLGRFALWGFGRVEGVDLGTTSAPAALTSGSDGERGE